MCGCNDDPVSNFLLIPFYYWCCGLTAAAALVAAAAAAAARAPLLTGGHISRSRSRLDGGREGTRAGHYRRRKGPGEQHLGRNTNVAAAVCASVACIFAQQVLPFLLGALCRVRCPTERNRCRGW